MMKGLRQLLDKKISQVEKSIKPQGLITVYENDSIADAFRKLVENKIQSVPCLDQFGTFLFFVDVVDFVNLTFSEVIDTDLDDITTTDLFQDTTCGELGSRFNKMGNILTLESNDNLLKTIRTMISLRSIKRLPINSLSGNFEGMISQSDVLKILNDNIKMFPIADMTVDQMNIGSRNVITVEESENLSEAFSKISSSGLSGVAVVDSDGYLVGNISGSDIKVIGLNAQLMKKLNYPIQDNLGLIQDKLEVVSVTLETGLIEVCETIAEKRMHRIYIVDEDRRPIGVISISDVLEKILEYC